MHMDPTFHQILIRQYGELNSEILCGVFNYFAFKAKASSALILAEEME